MGPAGADGSQGLQGPQGAAGPQGSGLQIVGQVDNAAGLDSIADPKHLRCQRNQLAVWDGGEWFFIERLTSTARSKGDQGSRIGPVLRVIEGGTSLQGEQGEQGLQGIQGPQGAQGPTGSGLQVAEVTSKK